MNLEPSKLSKQADQVWNESTRLFQAKKANPGSIGFGFSSKFAAPKTGGETSANGSDEKEQSATPGGVATAITQLPAASDSNSGVSGGSLPGGYVFGSRLAERVEKKVDGGGVEQLKPGEQSGGVRPKDVSSIFGSFKRASADGEAGNATSFWKVQAASKSQSHNPAQSDNDTGTTTVLSTLHLDPPNCASDSSSLQASIEAMEKKQQSSSAVVGGTEGGMSEPITTGEEEERNLLNINCKFYHFNRDSKSWVERGLGTLRVNQRRGAGSGTVRVIGRSSGNQKILINSKIWSEMILEEVSEKRLKISAQNSDSPIPQLFIIQANPSHVVNLYALLEKHIALAHEFSSSKSSRKRKAGKKTPANDCEEDEASGLERVEEEEGEQDSSEEVHSKRPEMAGDEENGSSDE